MSFNEAAVRAQLNDQSYIIDIRDTVSSTNTLLKQLGRAGSPHGTILAANAQTEGRGRMGRDFFSPADTGLYFSILLRPPLSPSDSLLLTTAAAVACARVLSRVSGKHAQIKWVNDIYIDNKKVCGILTEAAVSAPEKLDFAVLGIGININTPKDGFPAPISALAGALSDTDDDLRSTLLAQIVNEFFSLYLSLPDRRFAAEYRSLSLLDGLDVTVITPTDARAAKALHINEDFSLAVQYPDGKIEHLTTGDVSVKLQ